jgi:hypothetical protein
MMHFYKKLYLSPDIKNVNKLKWRLRTGRGSLSLYLLVLNKDSKKLEYFHNGLLKQKFLHRRDMDIVGLATGADACMELIEKIVSDSYEATGKYDAYDFLAGV